MIVNANGLPAVAAAGTVASRRVVVSGGWMNRPKTRGSNRAVTVAAVPVAVSMTDAKPPGPGELRKRALPR